MLRVGFVVNPVAGMGGAVGLKGTDGEDILREAKRRGARAQASERADAALRSISLTKADLLFLTCKGEMGEDSIAALGIPCDVVCGHGEVTTPQDTREAARAFVSREVDIIVFVGGDGTARDILSEAGTDVPIVGVPSGVKMHSAVFVNTPSEFGGLLRAFQRSKAVKEAEVLDIDEGSFREGVVRAKLFGIALTPDSSEHIQAGIGAQGFFFGRGNQQISAKVIRAAGADNVVVVSTPSKLCGTPVLRIDTGDRALDEEFRGNLKVVTGYKRKRLVKVA